MLLATPNQPIPLTVLAADGLTSLFPQARVYSASGSLVATVNLSHVSEGLYSAMYTPTTEGIFDVVYQFYTDSGRTQTALYDKGSETLDVNSERTNIMRILGLMHENSVFDQQQYNAQGSLVSGRVRSYDTAANAALGGLTGLLFVWTIQATYNPNNKLVDFKIQRNQ